VESVGSHYVLTSFQQFKTKSQTEACPHRCTFKPCSPFSKTMTRFLKTLNKGICSICSANEFVLRTAFRKSKNTSQYVLIESTSNQVNQFGGYTGMTPKFFASYVRDIAISEKFPIDRLVLGGDHLGPNTWRNDTSYVAMNNACNLITDYVKAGYTKIHLDTSMLCRDDAEHGRAPLRVDIVAERAARLCQIAEDASNKILKPYYIIGTDVPEPGGAKGKLCNIRITAVNEVKETIEKIKAELYRLGLVDTWERVIAVVVQPGVEFGNTNIAAYDRKNTRVLSRFIENTNNLVYEVHSTDYQTKSALRQMVEDHFSILKVGPWLTFALREALFNLAEIEYELFIDNKGIHISNLINTIENQMIKNPQYWTSHYQGEQSEIRLARKYSYSDRIRYYWPNEAITRSLQILFNNLSMNKIPVNLLSQYMPVHYRALREGQLNNNIQDLIDFSIGEVLDIYAYATSC
jgi:D-tagatose-1,6-bisphosphate aldolase subunit GatZ/KbaZ